MNIPNRNVVHTDVFNIARNLFGAELPGGEQLKDKVAIQSFVQSDETGKLMAVYPAVVDEAFSKTMENYRKYVALKNFQVSAENDQIKEHNNQVRNFKKANKGKLTEVQIEFSKLFPKSHKSLNPTEYNAKVDAFNSEYGMLVHKRQMLTIKPAAELIFQNMLFMYNQQLMKKNKRYRDHKINVKTPIEPFKVNAWKVTQLKRNDHKSIDFCRKTILNHRQRFEEFGVFTDYYFAGSQRAVEVQINPAILVLKDLFNEKLVAAGNQVVTSENGKLVPNENEKLTGTLLNESERKENGKADLPDKEFPSVTPFNLIFTGTPTGNTENPPGGGAQSVKVSGTPSEIALSTIIPDHELAQGLSLCKYNNYKPLDLRYLERLAYSGVLTREEFYEVAMIDFLKSLQKNLYKTPNVYPGEWVKTIRLFRVQRWHLWTGDPFQKEHILSELSQYRWRVQWARNWFDKNKTVNPLFPGQYLDVTRTNSTEIGFEYTKLKWQQMKSSDAKYDALIKKREAEARRRGEMINHNKKMEMQLKRFFKNRMTLSQLYDYTEKNLPPEFREKLPDLIDTYALKLSKVEVKTKWNPDEF